MEIDLAVGLGVGGTRTTAVGERRIASQLFGVTLVTMTPEKAHRLRTSLSEKPQSLIPVHGVAVPRLLSLTGSIRAPPRSR